MKKPFYKLHNEFQNKIGFGVREGDCDPTVAGMWHPQADSIDADNPRSQVC